VRIVEGISLHLMNTETRIAAAACVPGVGRRCYRFTRPGQMKTPPPTWTGPSSRASKDYYLPCSEAPFWPDHPSQLRCG
jgi:hypothetical protein